MRPRRAHALSFAPALVVGVALTAACVPGTEQESGPRPDVIFVLVDTLRADRLSLYGYARQTTPVIDELANHGIVFERVIAQSSWTKTSMASLWTGTYPAAHGVLRFDNAIPDEAVMPAEIFKAAGYRTVGIWRNGWVAPNFGFAQGFDVYYTPKVGVDARLQRHSPGVARIGGTDEDVLIAARDFLEQFGQEKFFLYLHLMDVHQYVYDEDTALFGTTYSDIYDNSIRWVDRVLGSLTSQLDARGPRGNTMIVLAADHGEAFGEHGREGHARDVYGEVTTTPLIVSFPFRLEPGAVVETATENVDIWPTLLNLLGLPPLADDVDGRSRRPEILAAVRGEPEPKRDSPRFAHPDQTWGRGKRQPRPMVSVSDGPYRLFRREGKVPPELYDLSTDRYEQIDLAEERPEVLERMVALAEDYLAREPAEWADGADVEIDPQELEQLRALGYKLE